jgi:hypothetical protein
MSPPSCASFPPVFFPSSVFFSYCLLLPRFFFSCLYVCVCVMVVVVIQLHTSHFFCCFTEEISQSRKLRGDKYGW